MKKSTFLKTFTLFAGLLFLASSGWGQGFETFENMPTTSSSSYLSRSWTGTDGVTWTAEGARTDQTIDGKAICWGNSGTTRNVISPTYSGGMGTLSFDYVRAFTGTSARSLEVYVNGNKIGETITVSPTSDVVVNYSETINVAGNVVLEIRSTGAAQVKLDNISWTGYTSSEPLISVNPISLSGFTYVEGEGPSQIQSFTVSGSNLTNNVTISIPTDFEISSQTGNDFAPATENIILAQVEGSVSESTFYVRLKAGLAAGNYSETLQITSTGAETKTVAVSGVVAPPPAPVASFTETGYQENFDGFTGEGFSPSPATGKLHSGNWRVTGMSDGDGTFDDTYTTGDFARGTSTGGVTTGGVYAFTVAEGVTILGVQPGASDFTPGAFTLKLENTTQSTIEYLDLSYDIYVYNDQDRSSSFNFAYSLDDENYNQVPALDYTTPEALDEAPVWVKIERSATLLGLNFEPGNFIYLQWNSDDVGGSGSRDEFGLTNISLTEGQAPIYSVTFNVDMSTAINFDPDQDDLYITGNFFGWAQPGTQPENQTMSRIDDTMVWTKTLEFEANDDYQYKYFINSGWDGGEWGANPNRKIAISQDTTIEDLFSYITFSGTGNIEDPLAWDAEPKPIDEFGGVYNANLLIKGSAVVNSDIIVYNNLMISPAGNLTVTESGAFSVNGLLQNNAGVSGLVIKGGGSLIHNTAGVLATVEADIAAATNWPESNDGWFMISSPVANQAITGAWIPESGYDFYAWDEPLPGTWLNQKVSENNITHFNPTQGYLVAYAQEGTKTFAGALNNGVISVGLNFSGGTKNDWEYEPGWNLIGNPYASGINWSVSPGTGFAQSSAAVYNSINYEYIEGYLPPNQGFFVLANGNASTFNFDNSMRTHGGGDPAKANETPESLVLSLSNGAYADPATIRILDGTEFTRDFRDAVKMFSFADFMPQLYSYTTDQVRVAINSVPNISEEVEFTLGLRIPAAGEYTLSANELSGAFLASPLYLRDLQTGAVHNLQQSPEYSFQATQGDDPARFIISFAQPTNVPTIGESLVNIYTWGQTLHVNFTEEASNRLLQVYDLSGRLVMNHKLNHGLNHTQQLNVEMGVYIVRISSPAGVATQRVFVR